MSSSPTSKEIGVRWFEEVWNRRNLDLIPQLLAEDAIGHLEGGQDIVGPIPFMEFQKAIVEVLPDIHLEILNVVCDGDDACVLWLATATHTGHGMGLVPTGKKVSFRGTTWFRVKDGKFVEGWDCWNQGGLMSELAGG
jgi:steroid delta-isomerase-like uncharacterized protein